MTKLVEWLSVFSAILAAWYSLITGKLQFEFVKQNYTLVLFSPIILIALFGMYALVVVLYRTFTFNECPQAAVELKTDIQDAVTDLGRLGFVFND